jgi:hypothetical protein
MLYSLSANLLVVSQSCFLIWIILKLYKIIVRLRKDLFRADSFSLQIGISIFLE